MTEAFLSVRNISFSYDAMDVLCGFSFEAMPGNYISLVGLNGSGKTTLFNILSGYYPPKRGSAHLYGREIRNIPVGERATMIALVAQRQNLDFPFTCLESVLMGLHPHRARFESVTNEHLLLAKKMMQKTDTWQFADKLVTTLSGGELQRVILARALLQRPKLLLLDEAMSELDLSSRIAMIKLLRKVIAETNMTVIAIHHDLTIAYRYSDRVIALQNGKITADGTPDHVFTEKFLREVFLVDAEMVPGRGFFINDNI